jgi:uncharacterized protein with von Willebrand factor type A (vWA) domain
MKLGNLSADGSTSFAKPFNEVLTMVQEKDIKQLNVLFLTDGQDLTPTQTLEVVEKLLQEINRQEITCKISVIGLGDD